MSYTLGSRLKKARENNKKTQQDVCKELDISIGTLSGYERNYRRPDPKTIEILAGLYGVTTDYLIRGETSLDSSSKFKVAESSETIYGFKPSSRDRRDLKKFLEQQDVMFDGIPATDEDKQRLIDIMTGYFWEAKQMNKRKKNPSDENE